MEFSYLDLFTMKAALEFTQKNSVTLDLECLIKKLDIAINSLMKNPKKDMAVLTYE